MNENTAYLKSLAKRAEFFYSTKKKALQYISKNRIKDRQLCINLILMSAFWAANSRNECLLDDDLQIFFGLTAVSETDDNFLNNLTDLKCIPDQENMTLFEIFDLVVATYKG